jgi:carbamoylphosphate synthase small subunit
MSMKNSNDSFGYRTRDLPAFSAVPQPNVSPGAHECGLLFFKFNVLSQSLPKRGRSCGVT